MPISTGYLPTNDVEVYFKDEATLGVTETTATGYTRLMPTSFTIPEVSADIEESASVAGRQTKSLNQAVHRRDTKVFTFDLTFKGNAENIDWVMKYCIDSVAEPKVLSYDYSCPKYADGSAVGNSFKLLITNVGTSGNPDLPIIGCIITGFTIGQSIDSENGECVITANCMTGYRPSYANQTVTSPTTASVVSPYNIKDNDTYNINNGTAEDLMIYSWELSASRPVERIGSQDYTDTANSNKPYGYAMTGAWEVSGSLSVKKDSELQSLYGDFNGDGSVDINIGKSSSGLLVDIPTAMLTAEIDNGGSFLKENISFKAYSATQGAGNLFAITTG